MGVDTNSINQNVKYLLTNCTESDNSEAIVGTIILQVAFATITGSGNILVESIVLLSHLPYTILGITELTTIVLQLCLGCVSLSAKNLSIIYYLQSLFSYTWTLGSLIRQADMTLAPT